MIRLLFLRSFRLSTSPAHDRGEQDECHILAKLLLLEELDNLVHVISSPKVDVKDDYVTHEDAGVHALLPVLRDHLCHALRRQEVLSL